MVGVAIGQPKGEPHDPAPPGSERRPRASFPPLQRGYPSVWWPLRMFSASWPIVPERFPTPGGRCSGTGSGALSLPPLVRRGRGRGQGGKVFGRPRAFNGFADVIELNPDAVEALPADAAVAAILDDEPFDGGDAPEQAHAVTLAERAGGQR